MEGTFGATRRPSCQKQWFLGVHRILRTHWRHLSEYTLLQRSQEQRQDSSKRTYRQGANTKDSGYDAWSKTLSLRLWKLWIRRWRPRKSYIESDSHILRNHSIQDPSRRDFWTSRRWRQSARSIWAERSHNKWSSILLDSGSFFNRNHIASRRDSPYLTQVSSLVYIRS